MSDNGDLREDLKCPDGDIGNQIKTDFENGRELLVCILTSPLKKEANYHIISLSVTVHSTEGLW